MFFPKDKVYIVKISEKERSDFSMAEDRFEVFLKREGQKATIMKVHIDGRYDIKFDDGFEVYRLDSYHIVGRSAN